MFSRQYSTVSDSTFLKKLDADRNKVYYVQITVLDMNENPVAGGDIEARISAGSINIDGSSSVRRTCNMTFIIENMEETFEEDKSIYDYLLAINRKIKIVLGVENHVDPNFGEIIGFPLGVFVINQINCTHSVSAITVQMSCKDKMCLLNGDCGGKLPTSITFDSYDQYIGLLEIDSADDLPNPKEEKVNEYMVYSYISNGKRVYKKFSKSMYEAYPDDSREWYVETSKPSGNNFVKIDNPIYDIIQTVVCNFGKEDLSRIFINDVDLKLKQLSRWTGGGKLYYNAEGKIYTTDLDDVDTETDDEGNVSTTLDWRVFTYGQDVGYEWIDFVYPGELITGIGDSVSSVLDKIIEQLGNYEYFYDVEGNFIFQEKRNYLNTSYDPTNNYRLDVLAGNMISLDGTTIYLKDYDEFNVEKLRPLIGNDLAIIDETNYYVDFSGSSKSEYTFVEDAGLVTTFTNAPNYTNIKNDYHIWGKNNSGYVNHYHLAIKEKPIPIGTHIREDNGEEVNYYSIFAVEFDDNDKIISAHEFDEGVDSEDNKYYTDDWRAHLYLTGFEKQMMQERPDVYEQELLDLFDDIYDFKNSCFRTNVIKTPNELSYWFDYLEPIDGMEDYSVDNIGTRIYSYQQDNIKRLFDEEAPDVLLLDVEGLPSERAETIARCAINGDSWTDVSHDVYKNIVAQTAGYSAQEVCRSAMYEMIEVAGSITIQAMPIYYLEPNTRITVRDLATGIYGDYIIKSISLPLDAKSPMSIQATKALERL